MNGTPTIHRRRQRPRPTDLQAGLAVVFTFREETNTFLNNALYEQRILKSYKATIDELKRA